MNVSDILVTLGPTFTKTILRCSSFTSLFYIIHSLSNDINQNREFGTWVCIVGTTQVASFNNALVGEISFLLIVLMKENR